MSPNPIAPMSDPRESIRPVFSQIAADGAGNIFCLDLMPRMTFPPAPPQVGIRVRGPLVTMVVGLDDDAARKLHAALTIELAKGTS